MALVDLLDRLLAGGAVVAGDLTLRIADVDLVRIDLRALISSVNDRVPSPFPDAPVPPTAPAPEEHEP
ncbi:gas vesicle protein [Streptomyces sp. ODS28]|uniref:gas vesicle protein n=1 Tax=Streptomyces sp. ODS28 TaxID=3136688 RepID=UPI0031EC5135